MGRRRSNRCTQGRNSSPLSQWERESYGRRWTWHLNLRQPSGTPNTKYYALQKLPISPNQIRKCTFSSCESRRSMHQIVLPEGRFSTEQVSFITTAKICHYWLHKNSILRGVHFWVRNSVTPASCTVQLHTCDSRISLPTNLYNSEIIKGPLQKHLRSEIFLQWALSLQV